MRHCRPCSCRWRAASSSTPLPTGASMWSIWWSRSAALPIRKICFSRASSRSVPGLFPHRLTEVPRRSTAQCHRRFWRREVERRMGLAASSESLKAILPEGSAFCPEARWRPCRDGGLPLVRIVGRDTLIALPGLTFYAGRPRRGHGRAARLLGSAVRDGSSPTSSPPTATTPLQLGRTPPLAGASGPQQMPWAAADRKGLVRERCWPVIKNIIEHWRRQGSFLAPAEGSFWEP